MRSRPRWILEVPEIRPGDDMHLGAIPRKTGSRNTHPAGEMPFARSRRLTASRLLNEVDLQLLHPPPDIRVHVQPTVGLHLQALRDQYVLPQGPLVTRKPPPLQGVQNYPRFSGYAGILRTIAGSQNRVRFSELPPVLRTWGENGRGHPPFRRGRKRVAGKDVNRVRRAGRQCPRRSP